MEKKDLTPKVKDETSEIKAQVAIQMEEQRLKDREMVRGIFRYHELPKGQMEFMYKAYKKDPLEKFSFVDGEIYTVPRGVAVHLNKNLNYPTYNYKNDEQGRPQVSIAERVHRTCFQSLEFSDLGDSKYVSSALPR